MSLFRLIPRIRNPQRNNVDLGKSLGIPQGEMLNFITEYIKSDRDEQTKQREIEKKKRLKRMNVERNYALKKMIESIEKKTGKG